MSTKHIRTAADLVRFKAALSIRCGRCRNTMTVSGVEIVKVFGAGELKKIGPRLKCSLCGAKEAKLEFLLPPPPRN